MSHDAEMPGAWVCDKCGFVLQKNVLHVPDGEIRANMTDECDGCPNDGLPMRALTWREANEMIYQQLMLETRRLNWLDEHCSFVADAEYFIGPFKIGELRKMADAGIAEDEKRKL